MSLDDLYPGAHVEISSPIGTLTGRVKGVRDGLMRGVDIIRGEGSE